jgi:hypothetical protein
MTLTLMYLTVYGSLQIAVGVSRELPAASEFVLTNRFTVSLEIPPLPSEKSFFFLSLVRSRMCLPVNQTHPSHNLFIKV